MKFNKNFSSYLQRASNLLDYEDQIQLTYCALELRRAIELLIWTQFKDTFSNSLSANGMYSFDYGIKLQRHGISKMYKLLKMHIKDYSTKGAQRVVTSHFSAVGNAPYKKDGDVCYIPPELPTNDYKYLSEIIHYEKEIDPEKYSPKKAKLLDILDRLEFVENNYTYRVMFPNKDVDKIISNVKEIFNLTDDEFRSFP